MFFCAKKGQNVRFQTISQGKATIIEGQLSQNVNAFMIGTACFFNWFLVKKEQNVRFHADFQEKTLIKRTTIFSKRNGFL